jgi:hypothetical protein
MATTHVVRREGRAPPARRCAGTVGVVVVWIRVLVMASSCAGHGRWHNQTVRARPGTALQAGAGDLPGSLQAARHPKTCSQPGHFSPHAQPPRCLASRT